MARRHPRVLVLSLIALLALVTSCTDGNIPSAPTSTATSVATSAPKAAATATQTPAAAATVTPADLALVRQFVEAVNAGNVAGAVATLDEAVIWERGGQCPPLFCKDRQAAERELTRDVANHHALVVAGTEVSAGGLKARMELRNDGIRGANVDRIIQIWALETKAGKLSAVRVTNDPSDPTTAAFLATPGGGPGVGR